MVTNVLLLLTGFVILVKGADFLVKGASSVARRFNISTLVIGLTIVSFGTSAPELTVNLIAAFSEEDLSEAVYGNIIGSNLFNLLFILGISGIIYPLVVQRDTVRIEVPISLMATILLFLLVNDQLVFGSSRNALDRVDGVILLAAFAGFLYYIFLSMRRQSDYEESPIKVYTVGISTLMILGGLLALVGGGTLVTNNAVAIAEAAGLSRKLIGLTILAVGTSLPELATSAVAAYRKSTDIAIGNVVGSNIFNVLGILGINSSLKYIPYNSVLNTDILLLSGGTVLLLIFMFTLNTRKLDRWEAVILIGIYIAYTAYLINRN
jgi:cation:H+ antiporter